jgi:hypothetical protein
MASTVLAMFLACSVGRKDVRYSRNMLMPVFNTFTNRRRLHYRHDQCEASSRENIELTVPLIAMVLPGACVLPI